jgi:pilus assembly protein TadC
VFAVVGLALLPVFWPASVAIAVAMAIAPRRRRARSVRRHADAVIDELPDAIDVARAAVDAGATARGVSTALARLGPATIAPAFAVALAQAAAGRAHADALEAMVPQRLGHPVRPLVAALCAGERYGVALGPTLDVLATDARAARRHRHELAARRLGVRLTLPLTLCTLPGFVLLAIAPVALAAFGSLRTP